MSPASVIRRDRTGQADPDAVAGLCRLFIFVLIFVLIFVDKDHDKDYDKD